MRKPQCCYIYAAASKAKRTVVVVVLAGELLRTEAVSLHEFARHGARIKVAKGVEQDLSDHCIVRHLHARHLYCCINYTNKLFDMACQTFQQAGSAW